MGDPTLAEARKVAEDAYWPFRRAVEVDQVDGCEHTDDNSSFVCGHCEQEILVRVLAPRILAFAERVREQAAYEYTRVGGPHRLWQDRAEAAEAEASRLREELEKEKRERQRWEDHWTNENADVAAKTADVNMYRGENERLKAERQELIAQGRAEILALRAQLAEAQVKLTPIEGRLANHCGSCGGPHQFDTSVPSVVWNAVIRAKGMSEFLCTTCIVREFVLAGRSFTATLWGREGCEGVTRHTIEVRVDEQVSTDSAAVQEENNDLRWKLSEAQAAAEIKARLTKAIEDDLKQELSEAQQRVEALEKALWSARFAMSKVNRILEVWDVGAGAWDIIADRFEGVSQEAFAKPSARSEANTPAPQYAPAQEHRFNSEPEEP